MALYQALGWRGVHIGEDPILWVERFTLEGSVMGNVRRGVRKVEESGIEVKHFLPGEHPFDAANDPDGVLSEIRAVSAEWMHSQAGAEKSFCMGRFDPHALNDVWLAVAWNPAKRRAEAFTTWVPIWARHGWALDLMRRRSDATPGVTESLTPSSVAPARARGALMPSPSRAPRAHGGNAAEGAGDEAGADAEAPSHAPRLQQVPAPIPVTAEPDRARAFLMKHLARFYDFENLFKWQK
jgi:phosphatidylglycerol lysyltransferase